MSTQNISKLTRLRHSGGRRCGHTRPLQPGLHEELLHPVVLLQRSVGSHGHVLQLRGGLHEELLQLGQDVLAIRVLAQRGHVRSDLEHEHLSLLRLRHVNHLLDHIVGELVFHHRVQGAVMPETQAYHDASCHM